MFFSRPCISKDRCISRACGDGVGGFTGISFGFAGFFLCSLFPNSKSICVLLVLWGLFFVQAPSECRRSSLIGVAVAELPYLICYDLCGNDVLALCATSERMRDGLASRFEWHGYVSANLEFAMDGGFTSLMKACQNGHELCARALLEAGSDRTKAVNGWTAQVFAEHFGHTFSKLFENM